MVDSYIHALSDARLRIQRLRAAIDVVVKSSGALDTSSSASVASFGPGSPEMPKTIYEALRSVNERCAEFYAQAYLDLSDATRVSWIGTVHQVREALATMLRTLAPDERVKGMAWFKPEAQDGRPTQKQRVRYIMQNHRAGSTEREVTEQIELIEDRVAGVVRTTYTRASTAAHVGTERREAVRILRYFEAFAHDLLDLE